MAETVDVVEFGIGGTRYALDILLAREIVEMVPITPVPRAPPYIAGIINLRGEITTILKLNTLLGLPGEGRRETQKIIVLVPDATNGSNTGIIVDDVHTVRQVGEGDVAPMDEAMAREAYVRGIIRIGDGEDTKNKQENDLIIWIDLQKVIREQVSRA
ncbi:chemotaxis protein CheW [Methanofollis ethanolicus]|uniref:chemotaxis protein CheW n=1 Tax=Methanofollis ethanolicus TaxID=488124 RepID=UPI0008325ABE|nr:chemotaxis protein CheW [Methanofollis ethanolicus]